MNWTTLIPWLVFATLTCLVWALANHFWITKDEQIADRLEALNAVRLPTGDLMPSDTGLSKVVNAAAPTLSRVLSPRDHQQQSLLRRSLSYAGFHSPAAPVLFLACKTACMIAGGMMASAVAAFVWGITLTSLTTGITGIALGCLIPGLILRSLQKRRHKRVFRSLPELLDLLVICIEAGQSLDGAMRRLAKELATAAPELSEELTLYNMQVEMGRPRREALHDLGARSSVEDMNSLATVLIQADRFGGSLVSTLRDLSDDVRVKRRQMAEERAQQTAVKLIFPLVLFIFPGIFAILVGPAAILLMRDMMSLQR